MEGAGLVPDGPAMRERPVAMAVHGGPGGDHAGSKPAMSPLADAMPLVYFDHRGQGRSGRSDPARHTPDENVEDMEALRRRHDPAGGTSGRRLQSAAISTAVSGPAVRAAPHSLRVAWKRDTRKSPDSTGG